MDDNQLTLWNESELANSNDSERLPLRVARHFQFPLQHHEIDGVQWYALQDWVRGLTGETNVKKISQIINVYGKDSDFDLKSNSQKLPYRAADNKTYQRDFVTNLDLYRIAAYLRQTSDRPSLKAVKEYLARAGAFVEHIENNPQWAAARLQGTISRKAFMAAIRDALANPPQWVYGEATNDVYKGVLGRDSQQLKRDLKADNPRDVMDVLALRYLDIAETICARRIGNAQSLSFDQARGLWTHIAEMIGYQVATLEQQLGIDITTGKPLLGGIDAIRG